ncbi:hypothetical protein [Chitinilyticum litopenaei]|uniref:hypothetical protein n=1 Tax=Chitinilyticum litopenaei TaxID=1121276 RepID=UPI001186132D|nr:hypothetical protein [Chitinilyticum litopenaei]
MLHNQNLNAEAQRRRKKQEKTNTSTPIKPKPFKAKGCGHIPSKTQGRLAQRNRPDVFHAYEYMRTNTLRYSYLPNPLGFATLNPSYSNHLCRLARPALKPPRSAGFSGSEGGRV